MSAVVEARGLTKRFRGGFTALDRVSFDLRENAVHGLLGRNGAGKTTLMRVLTGQVFASSGEVRLFGESPVENDAVLDNVCIVSEGQVYPDRYRIRHVLRAAELRYPHWDAAFANDLLSAFSLPRERPIKKLSRGMLSAVGIVVGLAARCPLTFFDEPYLGLDAVARRLFYDQLLADYAEHPRTIVLSTHLIDEVGDLLERVLLIEGGRLLIDEDADELRSRALRVSGPAAALEEFVRGHQVLHTERLGNRGRAIVSGPRPGPDTVRARTLGLDVEPVSLQDLIVRTTTNARREAGTAADDEPAGAETELNGAFR